MTASEAKHFGRTKILKATTVLVVISLIGLFIMETSGDFANGILFFIEAITNIHIGVILIILFSLTYAFGGKAGVEIIIDRKNTFLTSIKYIVLIIFIIILYMTVVGVYNDGNLSMDNFQRLLTTYFLRPLIKTGSITLIPMFGIWLWATSEMKIAIRQKTE